ncbi:MAG: hypothetical protein IJA83_07140 [Clostridia bacterium]|nr:hypothetical protein [Clostridia bacterium]
MGILMKAAVLLAAGAAGWALAKRNKDAEQENTDPRVVYLKDDEAVIDAQPQPVPATVKLSFRRMDPLTLSPANEAIFLLEDGTEVKLNFSGEGGLHLKAGDRGMLTWQGMRLIRFVKENGEVIGGVFYAPAQEAANDE